MYIFMCVYQTPPSNIKQSALVLCIMYSVNIVYLVDHHVSFPRQRVIPGCNESISHHQTCCWWFVPIAIALHGEVTAVGSAAWVRTRRVYVIHCGPTPMGLVKLLVGIKHYLKVLCIVQELVVHTPAPDLIHGRTQGVEFCLHSQSKWAIQDSILFIHTVNMLCVSSRN